MSIAVDAAGPDAARPFPERAGAGFPTLVDAHNRLGSYLGARVVPNGLLVNEAREIVWAKIGGFSVDNAEDVAVVDRWLADGTVPPADLAPADALRAELISTHLQLADLLRGQGDAAAGIAEMQRALQLDPDSFIVRKQIWMLRHPERFHPTIDFAWQKEQLARERAAEAACGPDGCPIPAATDRPTPRT